MNELKLYPGQLFASLYPELLKKRKLCDFDICHLYFAILPDDGSENLVAIHAMAMPKLNGTIQHTSGIIFASDAMELVGLQVYVLDEQKDEKEQSELGVFNVIAQMSHFKHARNDCDRQIAALSSSWIHAQNNLLSTISGYTELLALDDPENAMLEQIQQRCKQMSAFAEENTIFGRALLDEAQNKSLQDRIQSDDAVKSLLEKAESLVDEFLESEQFDTTQVKKQNTHLFGFNVSRWYLNKDYAIKSWDIESLYQIIGQKCHYLQKFALMRLQYQFNQIGGFIQTIDYPGMPGSVIELWFPCSAPQLIKLQRDKTINHQILVTQEAEQISCIAKNLIRLGQWVWIISEQSVDDLENHLGENKPEIITLKNLSAKLQLMF